jgi:hypothetical protein
LDDGDEKTADESLLDALALEVASQLRRRGSPLPISAVMEELRRSGVTAEEAAEAVEYGVRHGALVLLGESMVDAGIVRGWL